MKIRDVMTPDIEVVTPGDTLTTAVQLMAISISKPSRSATTTVSPV
jgi:hypothetical protein